GPDGGGVGDAEHECGAEVRLDHCPEAAVVGFRLALVSDFGPGVVGGPSTVCGAIGEGGPHHFGHDHEHRDADRQHHHRRGGVRHPHGDETGGDHEAGDHRTGPIAHDAQRHQRNATVQV